MSTESLRHHPNLQEFIQNCQGRHPDDEEFDIYNSVAPGNAARASAAAEIRDVEGPIVRKIVRQIFDAYPFDAHHDLAVMKATRDIRMVVIYASLSMLLGDPDWFKNKLLFWMKKIIQAFEFPDKLPNKQYIFKDSENQAAIQKLKPFQRSIYETFLLLREEMRKALSEESYQEIEPFLQLGVEILSND